MRRTKEEWEEENKGVLEKLYNFFCEVMDKPLKNSFGKEVDWESGRVWEGFCNFMYEISDI